MDTSKIKKELHQYIDKGDDRFLGMIHAIATTYESDEDYILPVSPMDVENYRTSIRKAQARVKAGNYTTQEDLEKEMEQW